MKKYRRIEVNAYQRRVAVVSAEWRPDDFFDGQGGQTDDGVSLDDSDACEPVSPDSPEGQLILVEAVRTLEQRLTPETRATIGADQNVIVANRNALFRKLRSSLNPFARKLWALFERKTDNVTGKEK